MLGPTSATHAGSATCASLLPLVHFPFHPAPLCAILHIICRHLHLEGLCEHKDRTLLPAAFVRPLPSAVVAVVAVAMHGPWPSPSRAANARARERSLFLYPPCHNHGPSAIGHRTRPGSWAAGQAMVYGQRAAPPGWFGVRYVFVLSSLGLWSRRRHSLLAHWQCPWGQEASVVSEVTFERDPAVARGSKNGTKRPARFLVAAATQQ